MRLARDLLHQIANQNLSESERANLRCRLAGQLQEAGNYEAASETLGELWQGVCERPKLDGLTDATSATVLLRVGSLTRDIGSAGQIKGAQETAKDLLTESISLFQALRITDGVAEAQIEMAVCYRREGAFDEARVMLKTALENLRENRADLIALAMLRSATVEGSAQRFHDALRIYAEAAPLIEKNDDPILSGKFHHCFGTLLKKLGVAEQCQDYIDRALIEFAAASFYFEEAELTRHQASVENNLGFLYFTIGKLAEAHEHLDRAQALFTSLRDRVHLAQVDETRARILLAEGKIVEAEKLVSSSVQTLETGGEQSLLAEALSTQGIALTRMRDFDKAQVTLERAVEVAEQVGDTESAAQATLLMIEQLGTYLSNNDLKATVDHALQLLKNTQDMSTLRRLVNCIWQVLSLIHASPGFPASVDWSKFSVTDEVLRYEAHFVRLALKDSGGSHTSSAFARTSKSPDPLELARYSTQGPHRRKDANQIAQKRHPK